MNCEIIELEHQRELELRQKDEEELSALFSLEFLQEQESFWMDLLFKEEELKDDIKTYNCKK